MTCQGSEAGRASLCGQAAAFRSQAGPHRLGRNLQSPSPSAKQPPSAFPIYSYWGPCPHCKSKAAEVLTGQAAVGDSWLRPSQNRKVTQQGRNRKKPCP